MKEVIYALIRLSTTVDGKTVLNYLRRKVYGRILSPEASTQELWYLEGQRAFIATMDKMIEQGKTL